MRIISYNIHKGIGGRDRRYRLARIIEVIEEQNADIICLQEVDRHVRRSRFDDQAQLLGDYFQCQGRLFQLNVTLKWGGYGNLLLSRWPFQARHRISLRLNSRKPRGAQLVTVETPEGMLHVVNWHLGLSEHERNWQVERLLSHRFFQENHHLPTLIIGDFNDWRNTLGDNALAQHGFEQVTAPASRFRSFPAYMPLGSLDKAFCRGGVVIRKAHVIRDRLTRTASDHLPLVIDMHLHEPSAEIST